ncbi:hypothetical protein Mmc1_2006 [Magnetococcus marinus MC-1]|uniref:Uncharacterized protein n=1 Tax=Magnetococcus marinus (strain ATCC BAA-1437 / JCM 17883 / MC-1) TaxID=156889 RepID=A0L964_MAGMM|nr:hypothetical protein [Magnetococcus marinus]ABK44507.1 hypothetical protein Mmc1_2006 [Magnetococcus marinus MC-1]
MNNASYQHISKGAVDPELVNFLQMLGDEWVHLPGGESLSVFEPSLVRKLTKTLILHSYGKHMLNLVHVTRVASRRTGREGGWFNFCWLIRPARARQYAYALRQNPGNIHYAGIAIGMDDNSVSIPYPDKPVTVNYAHMPLLVALMQLILHLAGPDRLTQWVEAWTTGPWTFATAAGHANRLTSALRQLLKGKLPDKDQQAISMELVHFLMNHPGFEDDMTEREALARDKDSPVAHDFHPADIEDRHLLDFWLGCGEANTPTKGDYKTFGTVVSKFVGLLQALRVAESMTEMEAAQVLGSDVEQGELDLGGLDLFEENSGYQQHGYYVPSAENRAAAWLDGVDLEEQYSPSTYMESALTAAMMPKAWSSTMAVLYGEGADQIKFLGKTERMMLNALIFNSGVEACQLPVSLLRNHVFGFHQGCISEAMRKKRPLESLLNQPNGFDYVACMAELRAALQSLRLAHMATAHILCQHQRSELITVLLDLRPELDPTPLKRLLPTLFNQQGVIGLNSSAALEHLMAQAADPAIMGDELSAFFGEAKRAFGKVNRQGFRPEDLAKEEIIDGHGAAAAALGRIEREIERWIHALEAKADRAIYLNKKQPGACDLAYGSACIEGHGVTNTPTADYDPHKGGTDVSAVGAPVGNTPSHEAADSWKNRYAEDLSRFQSQFRKLYGGQS